jgi:HlyD family secretion protein
MNNKLRMAVLITAGLGLAAVALWWFTWGKGGSRSRAAAGNAVRVDTIRPSRADMQRISQATPAELLPFEKTDLYAKISGYLKDIQVDYGSRVRKGQLLARVWVPELDKEHEQKKALVTRAMAAIEQAKEAFMAAQAGLRAAEAAVVEAEAGRTRARASYERWKGEYTRMEDLVRRRVIDRQNLDETLNQFKAADAALREAEAHVQSAAAARDESKAKLDKARTDIRMAEANLLVAQADRDRVAALLEYTRIEAPYAGVVTRRQLHTGAFLYSKADDPAPLTVVRTDRLRIVVDVPEKQVRYLTSKARIKVDLDALPGKHFEWPIARMAPVLGPGKRQRVEAWIANPDGTLYPGMYGHAAVILEDRPGVLTVPTACLGQNDKGPFVWLVMAGKARQRAVTLGLRDDQKAEIVAGLTGAEEVISSGVTAMREGQAVLVNKAKEKR